MRVEDKEDVIVVPDEDGHGPVQEHEVHCGCGRCWTPTEGHGGAGCNRPSTIAADEVSGCGVYLLWFKKRDMSMLCRSECNKKKSMTSKKRESRF